MQNQRATLAEAIAAFWNAFRGAFGIHRLKDRFLARLGENSAWSVNDVAAVRRGIQAEISLERAGEIRADARAKEEQDGGARMSIQRPGIGDAVISCLALCRGVPNPHGVANAFLDQIGENSRWTEAELREVRAQVAERLAPKMDVQRQHFPGKTHVTLVTNKGAVASWQGQ